MSDSKHIPGPMMSLEGTDDGWVRCLRCEGDIPAEYAWAMIRWPQDDTWSVLCRPCVRYLAVLANSILNGTDGPSIVGGF